MSSSSRTKQARDHAMDFQDLLNDLQDWERSINEKEKKLRGESGDPHNKDSAAKHEEKGHSGRVPLPPSEVRKQQSKLASNAPHTSNNQPQVSYMKRSDEIASMSFSADDNTPNAVSEKEQGNKYFKQKNFTEAIDCYSRSIALSPTAVAFANRAMAYLKIRKFQEAEDDCTEALNLDDRYVKAYSRRATARKELGKYQASVEDAEFALRLEPVNQELKKQYAESKALYDRAKVKKSATAAKRSVEEVKGEGSSVPEIKEVASDARLIQERSQIQRSGTVPRSQLEQIKGNNRDNIGKKTKLNVQELASRAAARAMESASKAIATPKTAYQFEVLWGGLSDDRFSQSRLLKNIDPLTLPQLFKNALSAPILMGIVKCIADFFMEDTPFAVSMLDNLSQVGRFDMIIMCLSDVDRADLWRTWDILLSETVVPVHMEALQKLHPKYCPQQWRVHVLQANSSVTNMVS